MKTLQLLAFAAVTGAALLPAPSAGQTRFNTLYRFQGSPDGEAPQGLVAGPNGALYGTTAYGGDSGYGTVFQLEPPAAPGGAWTETVLYRFTNQNSDGANPFASLAVGAHGALYGMTEGGGSNGSGTVFELQPPAAAGGTWAETLLFSHGEVGPGLYRSLVIGRQGELYGVASGEFYNNGEVFKLVPPAAPGGAWTVGFVWEFKDIGSGRAPAGLALGPDGVIFGTTSYGGSFDAGTVFALTPSVTLPGVLTETVLYSFTGGADGAVPSQPPVFANGTLYGTTSGGGSAGLGTVFELTPPAETGGTWTENALYSFGNSGDGKTPDSPLIVRDGAIYGTTAGGTGAGDNGGSVFELQKPAAPGGPWTEIVLHGFEGPDGPYGSLVLDKNGTLYGTMTDGPGPNGAGMVYRIKP